MRQPELCVPFFMSEVRVIIVCFSMNFHLFCHLLSAHHDHDFLTLLSIATKF